MNKVDFGRSVVFVVLISIVVWLVLWLDNVFSSWFSFFIPPVIGILSTFFLWKVWWQPRKQQTSRLTTQTNELHKLRDDNHLYRSSFEQANDIVYTVDLDGNFTYANATITQITGFIPDMLVGRHFSEFIKTAPDDDLLAQLEADNFQGVEVEFLTTNGRYTPLEINGSYLYTDGTATTVLGIARDITEKKKWEQELEEAKATGEQAIRTRTAFLNNIGHELRTPLSIILGYAEIISQEANQSEDSFTATLAEKIKLSTKKLGTIVNDLLQITEIESGQVKFLLETFTIEEIVDDAIKETQTFIDANNNDLILIIAPDINVMCADRDKVRAILVNLLSNAAKFTQDGTITFSAQPHFANEQEWILFQIADTGIGISPEQQEQIFQPFQQADNSVTRQYEGVGLGLAINQNYCQKMGGKIELHSKVNEGSIFSVYLPAEVTAVSSMFVRQQT